MRRPSASVVTISTVLPECISSTSPGLKASPPGRFSVAGTSATTSSGRSMAPIASIAPSTAAPPLMSNFMSSMPAEGFMEIPPESKVTALPTRTTGGTWPPLLCSSTIKRGSLDADRPTAASPVNPSASIPARSRTSRFIPYFSAISPARCARYSGVATLDGSLARSRASPAPTATFSPISAPIRASSNSPSPATSQKVPGSWPLAALLCCKKRYRPSAAPSAAACATSREPTSGSAGRERAASRSWRVLARRATVSLSPSPTSNNRGAGPCCPYSRAVSFGLPEKSPSESTRDGSSPRSCGFSPWNSATARSSGANPSVALVVAPILTKSEPPLSKTPDRVDYRGKEPAVSAPVEPRGMLSYCREPATLPGIRRPERLRGRQAHARLLRDRGRPPRVQGRRYARDGGRQGGGAPHQGADRGTLPEPRHARGGVRGDRGIGCGSPLDPRPHRRHEIVRPGRTAVRRADRAADRRRLRGGRRLLPGPR